MAKRILLTGATGAIGGRLLPLLEAAGHRLRGLAREPSHPESRVGAGTEVVAGDLDSGAGLDAALAAHAAGSEDREPASPARGPVRRAAGQPRMYALVRLWHLRGAITLAH